MEAALRNRAQRAESKARVLAEENAELKLELSATRCQLAELMEAA